MFSFAHGPGLIICDDYRSPSTSITSPTMGSNANNVLYFFGIPIFDDKSAAIKSNGDKSYSKLFNDYDRMLSFSMMTYMANFINTGFAMMCVVVELNALI